MLKRNIAHMYENLLLNSKIQFTDIFCKLLSLGNISDKFT